MIWTFNEYFAKENLQKIYYKYQLGDTKEWGESKPSKNIKYRKSVIDVIESYTFKENHVNLSDILTEKMEELFFEKNIWWYRAFASFDNNYKGERHINISDNNVCYNVNRLEDLKNIIDCRYSTIKGQYKSIIFIYLLLSYSW